MRRMSTMLVYNLLSSTCNMRVHTHTNIQWLTYFGFIEFLPHVRSNKKVLKRKNRDLNIFCERFDDVLP